MKRNKRAIKSNKETINEEWYSLLMNNNEVIQAIEQMPEYFFEKMISGDPNFEFIIIHADDIQPEPKTNTADRDKTLEKMNDLLKLAESYESNPINDGVVEMIKYAIKEERNKI